MNCSVDTADTVLMQRGYIVDALSIKSASGSALVTFKSICLTWDLIII